MNVAAQTGIAIASVLVLLGLMAVVRSQAKSYGLSPEVQRKLVHIGTGLYALTLPWLFADRWPVFMLIGLTLIVMLVLRLPGIAKGGLGETLHGVERQSYGDLLLALAVGTVFLLANDRTILYVLPIAILTLADAAAALTGSRYGQKFFVVEDGRKSLEGSVAFFMITLILSMICLLLLSDVPRANVILLSMIVAAFGTLVEADSWRGFDNFFLPAGLMVFLEIHLNTAPFDLLGLFLLFALAIWGTQRIAKHVGLTPHAMRVYVITLFLLLTVTEWQNTILPMLIFLAHARGRHTNPSTSVYPELDIVAALALTSFGWLAIGTLTNLNAVWFYGIGNLSLCLGFITLALTPRPLPVRLALSGIAGVALLALYHWLMMFNPAATAWHENIMPVAITAACLSLVIPTIRPAWFITGRAAKLTVLATLCPFLSYLWMIG